MNVVKLTLNCVNKTKTKIKIDSTRSKLTSTKSTRPRPILRLSQHEQDQKQDWVDKTKTKTKTVMLFTSLVVHHAKLFIFADDMKIIMCINNIQDTVLLQSDLN